jgi:hypothetical protein
MERPDCGDRTEAVERICRAAVAWMLDPDSPDWADLSLYHGRAGILLALREAQAHFEDLSLGALLDRGADELAAGIHEVEDSSLYFGLTGTALTLHALGLNDRAGQALKVVRSRCSGGRWSQMLELFAGNAGIGLGALQVGDLDLAVDAVTPYLRAGTRTAHGVNWAVRPTPARSHHLAHGTLGIVYALASVGHAAHRLDLIELALEGAADVVGRNEQRPDGFLVAHSDPPHRPDIIERYSLGWCNGPAGDAQVFRLLAQITEETGWKQLANQCWYTITTSGLPQRIRPGFWDNNGRCCGTAGVLALALDRIVENGDAFDFADLLVDDLIVRATVDRAGARWSNYEYRAKQPELEPRAGWAMGNAGIVRELLRYVRVRTGRSDAYAVAWPDHPATTSRQAE